METSIVELMDALKKQLAALCVGLDKEEFDIVQRGFRNWCMIVGWEMNEAYEGKDDKNGL